MVNLIVAVDESISFCVSQIYGKSNFKACQAFLPEIERATRSQYLDLEVASSLPIQSLAIQPRLVPQTFFQKLFHGFDCGQ